MQVQFNPNVNFKQYNTLDSMMRPYFMQSEMPVQPVVVQPVIQQQIVAPEKKASGLRRGISGFLKFFAAFGQMAKGIAKGLFYGVIAGVGALLGAFGVQSLPKAIKQGKESVKDIFRHPIKNISVGGKIIAGVSAGAVLGYHILKGWLSSNTKTAEIEHRWKTDHRDA